MEIYLSPCKPELACQGSAIPEFFISHLMRLKTQRFFKTPCHPMPEAESSYIN
ncbi:MAG: hypothetical protein JRJ23_02070 [Deltaproteobacteria bacterium]|nr:hypothetical protein [Deltaproteobacteria bacterium]